jgi:hypothetical protein
MAFSLSFAPDFFKREGDDDLTPENIESNIGKGPTSCYQALLLKTEDQWNEIAREVFGLDNGDDLDCDTVIDKIRETNTCGDMGSPVDVWIDDEGYFTLDVYDEDTDNG